MGFSVCGLWILWFAGVQWCARANVCVGVSILPNERSTGRGRH